MQRDGNKYAYLYLLTNTIWQWALQLFITLRAKLGLWPKQEQYEHFMQIRLSNFTNK